MHMTNDITILWMPIYSIVHALLTGVQGMSVAAVGMAPSVCVCNCGFRCMCCGIGGPPVFVLNGFPQLS